MRLSRHAVVLPFLATTLPLWAQAPAIAKEPVPTASTEPLIVDVHPSPYRPAITYTRNISQQRFDMRNATVLDMIESAYGPGKQDTNRENATIFGGPSWIDLDRFDISALIPSLHYGPATPAHPSEDPNSQIRPVLKRVLAERFHLAYHMEDRPLPAYVVTVAKDGPRLAEAKDPTAAHQCHGEQDKTNPLQINIQCTSETIAQLLSTWGGVYPQPIVDRTGLTSPYDFALKVTQAPAVPGVRTQDSFARAFTEAFGKQLGLVVTPGNIAQPAIFVDKVDRTPTPNIPEIAKLIPARPDLQFDVASIRLSNPEEPHNQTRFAGSQATFSSFSLQELLVWAWQLPTGAMLGDAPARLPTTRFTILAKLPPEMDGSSAFPDRDSISSMLQKLLIDRFQVKSHWDEWIQPDAYVLLPGSPRMKKADPNARSFCKFGPAEGEKDARDIDSRFDQEFHCQNVTMTQFADLMQAMAPTEIKNRVPNKTGLAGSYDFTLYYTAHRTLRAQADAATQEAKQSGDAAPAPVDGLSLEDAVKKQLGLRLERRPLTVRALMIDHFEPTPSEN